MVYKTEIIKKIIASNNNNNYGIGIYTFVNPYTYSIARKNLELYNKFDYIYVDGCLLVAILRFFGMQVDRRSFDETSLSPIIFSRSIDRREKVYFIGGSKTENSVAVGLLEEKYGTIPWIECVDGYLNDTIKSKIKDIKDLHPDLVICGMGAPLQEKVLVGLKESGWVGVGFTCGAFITQTSKGIKYYPDIFNKLNLRWLYRLLNERHFLKRFVIDYPKGIFHFIVDVSIFCLKMK
jgi:N-acetylglucosaminyldiphosphoundecaprenol N-acetyl-beta-D-mannosaminyltransferase